jgi:rubrerythrin
MKTHEVINEAYNDKSKANTNYFVYGSIAQLVEM